MAPPADWEEQLARRDREIAELRAQLAAAMVVIEELRALLKQNSSNSSKPPSSDPPSVPPKLTRNPSGRKRGGQPGHPRHERALAPPEKVTCTVEVVPDECEKCHHPLEGVDAEPYRHQVFELPELRPSITEYRLHGLRCGDCGHFTAAGVPDDVPTGNFGVRLAAFLAACTGYYHISRRQTQELARDMVGIDISLGALCDLERKTAVTLGPPVAEAVAYVQQQPSAHADETGWREDKGKAWLWTVVTPLVAVFTIARSRGSEIAKQLLGEKFAGILHSDRWSGYSWVSVTRRQLCWSHLARHFVMFQQYKGETCRLGESLQTCTEWMFHFWHMVRDGTMSRAEFIEIMRPMRAGILSHLRQGRSAPIKRVASMCREILVLEEALFTFVDAEGLEPTNNRAERAIRPAVLWRKGSFGSDSEGGSRFAERMLTVATTLRLQKRNVLEYLTQCGQAALLNKSAPSLLPQIVA